MIIGFFRRVHPASAVARRTGMMMGIVLQLGIANAPGAERRPDPSLIACAEGDKQEGYEATKQGRKWERKKWRKFRQDEREYTEKTYQRGADGKKGN